jgi:hypothetical protein
MLKIRIETDITIEEKYDVKQMLPVDIYEKIQF